MRRASFILLLLSCLVLACDSRPSPPASAPAGAPASQPASAPAAASAWGGSESCKRCHEEAYAEWKTSHHANALRDIVPELDHQAFSPRREIRHVTQTSHADMQDGRLVLTTMGPDGNQQDFEPVGVIGVDPLWQYLIQFPGDRLQATELAFDPAKKEWFNVYGDEDRQHWEWGHWTQRGMNWNDMCAVCHTTKFQKGYRASDDGYSSTYLEKGVGCEQCHGPMQAHNDWQDQHPDQPGDPTIPEFDRDRYIETCAGCHARRGTLTGNFVPGDQFLDHYDPVIPDLTDIFYPDGQVREEDFEYVPFSLSLMYAWGVRCTDCHYYHGGKVATTENKLCLRCHQNGIATKRPIDEVEHSRHPSDKPGFKCIDCHMPQTVYMARHWRRDHGMTIPDPMLTKEHGIPNACSRCHEKEGLDWNIKYVQEWYGQRMDRPTQTRARLQARLKAGDLSAAPDLLAMLREEKNPNWRAVNVKFLDAVLQSAEQSPMQQAVAIEFLGRLQDESPLVQATAIDALEPLGQSVSGLLAPMLASPSRLVRIKAAWALRRQIDLTSPPGRELTAFLENRWDQPMGAYQQARLLLDTGRSAQAVPWLERALKWDSRLAPARHEYATLLHQQGRSFDAVGVLHDGTRIEPNNAYYPYWLGLLYSEMGEDVAARDSLRAAVQRDASQARFWYNLSLAESKTGGTKEALDAIARAEQLSPRDPFYPYTRATIQMESGQSDLARQALNRCLEIDPQYRQALEMLQTMANR
ncbi:MAG: ammonia-forming cytochrome c nitrite reductase subunit c552 [Planctomycetes bacterium]|nr:ammonia-forming cytochrome c nitrite reductase subunit c552 [Planctomycetota bacterium]